VCGVNLRQKKSTLGEHLALLSVKYNVYPNEVFQAMVLARRNERATCGNLAVEYRGKMKKKIAKQNTESIYTLVRDLRAGMKRVNLKADVIEIPKPAQVHTQFGNTVLVVNALIGDDTGKIKLCLWEGQIGQINVGDNIEVKNGQVCVFRGEKQLRLGKNGSLCVLKSARQVKPMAAVR
jgi:replication factor A1